MVGLALDITGAILGQGPADLASNNLKRFGNALGRHPETARDRCRNRVDAEFGVAYLAGGFFLQAVGYSLDISGVPSESGTGRLIAALGMALIVAALAVAASALVHGARERQLIGEAKAEDDRRQRKSMKSVKNANARRGSRSLE